MIEIDLVQVAEPFRSAGNAAFNWPGPGRIEPMAFRVAGWFRRPRGATAIQVRFSLATCEGAEPLHWELRQVTPEKRSDVPCEPWEVALGFDAYVDAVMLPRTFRILISYRRESGEDCLIGEIHGRRTVLTGADAPQFQPVVVYHRGRMGSTAMMRALLEHPGIVVDDRFPYENSPAGYFSQVSKILLGTAIQRDVQIDRGMINRLRHTAEPDRNLSPDFQTYESIEETLTSLASPIGDFSRACIDRSYRLIGARTKKVNATFLAEKVARPDSINALLWLYPNVKLILLTRDPRDVIRSAQDFNAKRASVRFGRENADSDEDWIDQHSRAMCDFVDVFENHPQGDRLHVRFEDFMADTRGTLNRVCKFLGLENSDAVLNAMDHAVHEETPQSEFHRTASRGKEVGGWWHGLPSAHADRIVKRTRPFMQRFGYDTGEGQIPDAVDPSTSDAAAMPKALAPLFVSYSANFEDVMLRRLFPERSTGFFVDVGAAHPIDENDTKQFYDAGWHGINIEPNEVFFDALSTQRPRDRNLQIALADHPGTIAYYDVLGTGLSTCNEALADHARQKGHQVVQRNIPVSTLAEILKEVDPPAIDFLKIDVEGLEERVLTGNDWSRYRPSVILVEATVPESTERQATGIRALLAQHRYAWKYFDGLNDFYVAEEFAIPQGVFESPPNIFDRFKPRAVDELERSNAALATATETARKEAFERARQRDELERTGEEAVKFGHLQELRANELANSLAQLDAYARSLEHAREEAARYANSEHDHAQGVLAQFEQAQAYALSLRQALDGATVRVTSANAARDAVLRKLEHHIAALRVSLADRGGALREVEADVASLKALLDGAGAPDSSAD